VATGGSGTPHARVHDGCRLGVWADFSIDGEPSDLPAYDDEGAWKGRTVDGEWLADLLTSTDDRLHRHGVRVRRVRILGGLDLDGAELRRQLVLVDCQLGPHPVDLAQSRTRLVDITGSRCGGLLAQGADIGGNLILRQAAIDGVVDLEGATVGGSINGHGAHLEPANGIAVVMDQANLAGSVLLQDIRCHGEARLRGVTIGGDVEMQGAALHHPGATALDARNATVTGNLMLRDGFVAQGSVLLVGALVGANVDLSAGRIAQPGGHALNLGGAHVNGSIFLNRGFRAEGQLRMLGTVVDGSLVFATGAVDNGHDVAMTADNIRCAGGIYLTDGFVSSGGIRLPGASIGGNLDSSGARIVHPDGMAVDARGARIAGAIILDDGAHLEGLVTLAGATAAALRDDRGSWPERLDLDGFRYGRLDCPRADRAWKARRDWLRRQPRPGAQAYLQLANVYQAAGDELDARRIRMERHNVLLDPPTHWRGQLPDGLRGALGRTWRRLLRGTIGHGFEPVRALLVALPLVVAMAIWYEHARETDMLVVASDPDVSPTPASSQCTGEYPCVHPVVYAVDNLVPILDFGQRSHWTPDQSRRGTHWWDDGRWLAGATWLTNAVGWALATLAAAGFTQVIRRE
jgi:hypothetical protein